MIFVVCGPHRDKSAARQWEMFLACLTVGELVQRFCRQPTHLSQGCFKRGPSGQNDCDSTVRSGREIELDKIATSASCNEPGTISVEAATSSTAEDQHARRSLSKPPAAEEIHSHDESAPQLDHPSPSVLPQTDSVSNPDLLKRGISNEGIIFSEQDCLQRFVAMASRSLFILPLSRPPKPALLTKRPVGD